MEQIEQARIREEALATALRIDDMIRRGIETRDNLLTLFGLEGQIPSPAGGDAASAVILPPLADLDPDEPQIKAPRPIAKAKPAALEPKFNSDGSEFDTLLATFAKRGKPQQQLCGALLSLPRTFKADDLAKALGHELKAAYQTADRLSRRGILERVGGGLYHRILPTKPKPDTHASAAPSATLAAIKAGLVNPSSN